MLHLQPYLDRIDELLKQNAELRQQNRERDVKDSVQMFKELLKIYLGQGGGPKFGLTELPHKDLCNALFALNSLDEIIVVIDAYATKNADPTKPVIDRTDRFGALLMAYHMRMREEAGRLESILIFTNILLPTALQWLVSPEIDGRSHHILRNILDFMKVLSLTQRQAMFAQLQSVTPDQNREIKVHLASYDEEFQALISPPTQSEVKDTQTSQGAPSSLDKQEETKRDSINKGAPQPDASARLFAQSAVTSLAKLHDLRQIPEEFRGLLALKLMKRPDIYLAAEQIWEENILKLGELVQILPKPDVVLVSQKIIAMMSGDIPSKVTEVELASKIAAQVFAALPDKLSIASPATAENKENEEKLQEIKPKQQMLDGIIGFVQNSDTFIAGNASNSLRQISAVMESAQRSELIDTLYGLCQKPEVFGKCWQVFRALSGVYEEHQIQQTNEHELAQFLPPELTNITLGY